LYTSGWFDILDVPDINSILIDVVFNGNIASNCDVDCYTGVGIDYATDSFWDTETSGLAYDGRGGGNATGKTTAQMKQAATFPTWDFTVTGEWWITEGSTYPQLRVFGGAPVPGGDSELSYNRGGARGIDLGINRGVF